MTGSKRKVWIIMRGWEEEPWGAFLSKERAEAEVARLDADPLHRSPDRPAASTEFWLMGVELEDE